MKDRVLFALVIVLTTGVASAALSPHSYTFTLVNTGSGVSDARLRFHIDTLAVPGEKYFIDDVMLTCDGVDMGVVNGGFGAALAPWKFYTNAPAPKPSIAIVDGEAVISFGKDGSNTQLFQKDLVLPAAGAQCLLQFTACSTGGADDPGYGHNLGLKLMKHTRPYTNYGLNLNGNPPNPDVDLLSCSAPGTPCGDGEIDAGEGEECDEGGVNTLTCDSDCTLPECGDGLTNTAANEECDDGGTESDDGCDANCDLEPFCGDGTIDSPNASGQLEDCDTGDGTVANQQAMETALCDRNCTAAGCGDGTLNRTAGEQCDDGETVAGDVCDENCQLDLDASADCETAVCALMMQAGGPVPAVCPRFVDNLNGTVTDRVTDLVWLKDASCLGSANFDNANAKAAALGAGTADASACGLTDGSIAGDWRLPSLECLLDSDCDLVNAVGEFSSIVAPPPCSVPFIPDAEGTGCWSEGDAFSEVQSEDYWSSTTVADNPNRAWFASLGGGDADNATRVIERRIWPVRNAF